MLEKLKSAVYKKKIGALPTDLSKAFDCRLNEFLLAKLHAYGFSIPTQRLVYSYLKNRKKQLKKILRIAQGKKFYLIYSTIIFIIF